MRDTSLNFVRSLPEFGIIYQCSMDVFNFLINFFFNYEFSENSYLGVSESLQCK